MVESGSVRILYMEDDVGLARLVQKRMKRAGYYVDIAGDGRIGLDMYETGQYDVIAVDQKMPGYSGLEVIRILASLGPLPPIVMITGEGSELVAVEAMKIGAGDYIVKDVEGKYFETLPGIIERLLERQRLIEEKKAADEALRQAKKAAEEANRAKSAFLANMSHELRTPLNVILGFSQLIGRDANLDSEQQENLGAIRRSGEHLLNLINQVLDLSKIESGRATLDETNFDLHHMLDEMEGMFRLKAEEQDLRLAFECDADVPRYIRTDQGKLRQVLVNLLNNALKFTKEGGVTVKIEYCPLNIEKSGEEDKNLQPSIFNSQFSVLNSQSSIPGLFNLQFSISDTGPGIAPDEIHHLFEAFVQTRTGRESGKGTGLGLVISRRFIQLMGGEMQVDSKVGRGTTFTFHIQAALADAVDAAAGRSPRRVIALEPNQPHCRILIVDDKEDNRRFLVDLLNTPGFKTREAENGAEAVEMWETWRPRLVCMDMRMPVMDGREAVKAIREREAGSGDLRTVIIAISAGAFEEDRRAALAAGCDDFLGKPFHESDLYDLMAKHLGLRLVYEKSVETGFPKGREVDKKVLTPERVNALPGELTAALKISAEKTEPKGSNAAIDRIRKHDEPLADALAGLVGGYRFDIIQELLEENGKKTISMSREG